MTERTLSAEERARTARQLILPELGEGGQLKLAQARVAVVGAGGLGAPVISYLAAAGVGELVVIDDDVVELSNLQRQTIHDYAHLGRPKTTSATEIATRLSPATSVIEKAVRLTAENALELLSAADVIIDGSDSFDTRFLVNDAAIALGVPIVWGAVLGWNAQVTVLWPTPPAGTATPAMELRDLFADTPETRRTVGCSVAGVMGAVCGIAGSMMALEALKLITGVGQPLLGTLVVIDGLSGVPSRVELGKNPGRREDLPVAALAEIPAGAVIVDVRHAAEREAKPVGRDSLHLPLAEVLLIDQATDSHSELAGISSDSIIVTVCAEGPRSARAARHLLSQGYAVAGFLDGGLP